MLKFLVKLYLSGTMKARVMKLGTSVHSGREELNAPIKVRSLPIFYASLT